MKTSRFDDAPPYEAPNHFEVKSLRLMEPTGGALSTSLGLSYYLPGGRADMDASPFEKTYVMLDGELEVTTADGDTAVLRAHDTCRIAPGERRKAVNRTNRVATLLVVIASAAS